MGGSIGIKEKSGDRSYGVTKRDIGLTCGHMEINGISLHKEFKYLTENFLPLQLWISVLVPSFYFAILNAQVILISSIKQKYSLLQIVCV